MIKFIKNEKGSAMVNIIIALSITAVLTVGIVVAIYYVNSLFAGDKLEPVDHMNNAYASEMDRKTPQEVSNDEYKYMAHDGKAKLLGLSEEKLGNIKDSKVVIPEEIKYKEETYKVTEIGDKAFKDSLKEFGIKEVVIPNTVESIGLEAFRGNQLEKVIIPSSIKTIGKSAFQDNNLKEVELPKELVSLSENAFRGNQLESVSIPEKVEEICDYSFADNRLTSLNLGNSVRVIKKESFAHNQLTEINIPDSVKDIRKGSFKDNKIMKVTISEDVTLDDEALDGRFGDAYFFSLGEKGTYAREDEILYSWKKIG